MSNFIVYITCALLLFSCDRRIDFALTAEDQDHSAKVTLKKRSINYHNDEPNTVLYGDLVLENNTQDSLDYQLGKYALKLWDDLESESIYVNGYPPETYYGIVAPRGTHLAPQDTVVHENVYWVFTGYLLEEKDIAKITLSIH